MRLSLKGLPIQAESAYTFPGPLGHLGHVLLYLIIHVTLTLDHMGDLYNTLMPPLLPRIPLQLFQGIT